MDDEIKDDELKTTESSAEDYAEDTDTPSAHSDYKPVHRFDAAAVHHLHVYVVCVAAIVVVPYVVVEADAGEGARLTVADVSLAGSSSVGR